MRPVGLDQRELQGGSMVVEGTLTHPCPGFAVGKLAMVVVRVQGAPPPCKLSMVSVDFNVMRAARTIS